MKNFLYILSVIFLVSCEYKDSENEISVSKTKFSCDVYQDTLIYGMEPLNPSNTPVGFINIRKAFSEVKNNHHIIELRMENIPDNICYNNSNISRGFAEFGVDVIFRNKLDSTNIDNIVVSIEYNNFEINEGIIKCKSFQDFLNDCSVSLDLVNKKLGDSIEGNLSYNNIKSDIKLIRSKNSILIKIPKIDLCSYYENYLDHGFMVQSTYNNYDESDSNNYHTTMLNSDHWIRHTFFYNSSRRLE
jgi:hypothetical protein